MAVTAVELYERLRDKLGTEEASLLVRYVEESVERRAATKEDLLEFQYALEKRFTALEERLTRLEERVSGLEQRISGVEKRIDGLEQRIDRLEQRIERLEERIDRLEQRIERVEERIDGLEEQVRALRERVGDLERELVTTRLALERRIDRTFYLLLAAMIVLNGDKVLAVLNALLRLVR